MAFLCSEKNWWRFKDFTYTVGVVAWGGATGTLRVNNRDHENDGVQLVAYELSA